MRKDTYTKRAKAEGLIARSAYKLKWIIKNYHIIKPKYKVLDLGCSPGGWSKVALQIVGNEGTVTGIDIAPVKLKEENFYFIKGDIDDEKTMESLEEYNAVISDMAPKTTGQRALDQDRSLGLAERALEIAEMKLKKGGHFLCKIFQGPGYEDFLMSIRKKFDYTRSVKPEASKGKSKEMYIIGKGFKG